MIMSDDTRIRRAAALPARMPTVPQVVVERMQAHLLQSELPARGLPAAMQDFYARLDAVGLPAAAVTTEIFAAVGTSRTRLRALITGLRVFAPDVPLAPAAPVTQKWDAWLNARSASSTFMPALRNSRAVAMRIGGSSSTTAITGTEGLFAGVSFMVLFSL